MNKQHKQALEQAKANLADARERGADALGDFDEFMEQITSPEERAQIALRAALICEMTKARNERGVTQRKLEELSGVRQPVIARMETGRQSPSLDTVMKLLTSLGKTLQIVDLPQNTQPRT